MCLPAYSPDLNPIEEPFSSLLDPGLRNSAFSSRTREALLEAMGRVLDAVTADDARGYFGYFEHRGYRPKAQLL